MPADCRYLAISLQLEEQRLMDWAEACGLLDEMNGRSSEHTLQRCFGYDGSRMALDLLTEMKRLMEQYQRKYLRYENSQTSNSSRGTQYSKHKDGQDFILSNGIKLKKMPKRIEMLRRAFTSLRPTENVSRRFMWAVWNKDKVEELLENLMKLNNAITSLMNWTKQEEVLDITRRTNCSIVQLLDKVEDLEDLVHALRINRNPEELAVDTDTTKFLSNGDLGKPNAPNLKELASIKLINQSLEQAENGEPLGIRYGGQNRTLELDRDSLEILDMPRTTKIIIPARSEAIYWTGQTMKDRVWVEWKSYERQVSDGSSPNNLIIERLEKLVTLLQEPVKPADFRVLRCLGYFVDRTAPCEGRGSAPPGRVGLVFEKPREADQDAKPVSLLQLLEVPQKIESWGGEPSLTARIELALKVSNALFCLHAVGWLHKGLQSGDIVFFRDRLSHTFDLSKPYVMGFSFSRPDVRRDMTERPPRNPKDALYRHPAAIGDSPPTSFRKTYDIYSLGVVLTEIALWTSVDKILDPNATKSVMRKNVREMLLDDSILMKVGARAGIRYQNAVRTCLDGSLECLGATDGYDNMNALLLSEAFNTSVLRNIGAISC